MTETKKVVFIGLLIFSVSISFSQQAENVKVYKNSINFNPLGIALGSIAGNYEHLFGNRNGIMIQSGFAAGYGLGKGSGVAIEMQYRYHYFRKSNQAGLNSPFWGPFVYYEKSKTEIKDNAGSNYTVDIEYVKAGASWGRRWNWNNSFNLVFKIGYGIPFYANYKWLPNEPAQVKTIESLTTILAGIDGEFTMGFAF